MSSSVGLQNNKWKTFKSLTKSQKLASLEAFFFLFFAKLAVKTLHFKILARFLGTAQRKAEVVEYLTPSQLEVIKTVKSAINMAIRNVPWRSVCLDQAIAAKWMLKRRKINSALYFGVLPNEKREPSRPIDAHAWLMASKSVIVTGNTSTNFSVIAVFV